MRLLPLVVLIALAGCKVSVQPDPEAVRQVEQAGEVAKETASQAGQRAAEGVKKAAEQAGKVTQQGFNTSTIRAVLMNRKDIVYSDVDIETVEKTVYLRGSVPTRAEVSKVEEIAKVVSGPGYTIVNEMRVGRQP